MTFEEFIKRARLFLILAIVYAIAIFMVVGLIGVFDRQIEDGLQLLRIYDRHIIRFVAVIALSILALGMAVWGAKKLFHS